MSIYWDWQTTPLWFLALRNTSTKDFGWAHPPSAELELSQILSRHSGTVEASSDLRALQNSFQSMKMDSGLLPSRPQQCNMRVLAFSWLMHLAVSPTIHNNEPKHGQQGILFMVTLAEERARMAPRRLLNWACG